MNFLAWVHLASTSARSHGRNLKRRQQRACRAQNLNGLPLLRTRISYQLKNSVMVIIQTLLLSLFGAVTFRVTDEFFLYSDFGIATTPMSQFGKISPEQVRVLNSLPNAVLYGLLRDLEQDRNEARAKNMRGSEVSHKVPV